MTYFASENAITEQDMTGQPGWIEIDAAQHQAAFDALLAGREVAILGGAMVIRDKRPSEHHEWEDGEWVDKTPEPESPTPYQPRTTAMWRARAVAKATSHGDKTLFEAVVDAINAISDPLTKAAAEEAWERGTLFDLDGQLVPMLIAAVGGLTEADVLDLIAQAEGLPA